MYAVGAILFLTEVDRAPESATTEVPLVEIVVETLGMDRYVPQKLPGNFRILPRRVNGLTAAVADQPFAVDAEFVALGVPPEVVVIVENQDFRIRADALLT